MLIDTHSHLHFEEFVDIENDIFLMKESNVVKSILIWSNYESTENALKLAKKYDIFKVVAWLYHPIESIEFEFWDEYVHKVEKQIEDNMSIIVGIWEVWFDYYHLKKWEEEFWKKIQKEVFIKNINLAKKYSLPLIIHTRDAFDDTIELISEHLREYPFVIHCYTWDYETAIKLLEISSKSFIWFSWIVTFKNALNVQEAARKIPLERLLIETDAPYLAPVPHRWKLNTSAYIMNVLDFICGLRPENREEIEDVIYRNSLRFYNI